MSSFSAPSRRVSGDLDVYPALLVIAALVLAAGVAVLAMKNMEHSKTSDNDTGGVLKLVQ